MLNRIQSIVFDMAYNTNENLLVAAPTGAGKTNIALLTIIHEVQKGETAWAISRIYGVTVEEILKWNNKSDTSLALGERLKIMPKN